MTTVRIMAVALCVLAGACDWFDNGRECTEGAYSCDGDKARVCVPRTDEVAGADGPKTTWKVVQTCEDDPVLGALTCDVRDGQAQCVSEGVDGGTPATESQQEGEWRRVDVSADGSGYRIVSEEQQVLKGAPVAAASGRVAVVSYAGRAPLDAALVQIPAGGSTGTVWVRSESATRIALVGADGETLDERPLDAVSSKGMALLGSAEQALASELPPTLQIANPEGSLEPPVAWRGRHLRIVQPTAAALELVGTPLARLPLAAVSGLSRVVFASEVTDDDDAGVEDAGVANGAEDADGGVHGEAPLSRTELEATVLWVNVSKAQTELYEQHDEERRAFELEVVRRAGEAFVFVASVLAPDAPSPQPRASETQGPLLPSDFPKEIADLITARISPMLAPNEGFLAAWAGLHAIGVQAKIAPPYDVSEAGQSASEAVAAGFASSLGSQSATLDFSEYLAHASLADGWPDGPCDAIRGKKLDQLSPRLLMPIAKLQVLWGLGVLSRDNMVACVGELGVASAVNGLVLHKGNGEQVTLEDKVQGVRAPYLHGEIHVSGLAQRGNVNAVFDVMYRNVLPGVIRVKPVVNSRAEPWGASIALTNDLEYQTSVAQGGLVVITQVTRERIEAWGVMLRLSSSVFGESVYPLLTVRFDQPVWPEGTAP